LEVAVPVIDLNVLTIFHPYSDRLWPQILLYIFPKIGCFTLFLVKANSSGRSQYVKETLLSYFIQSIKISRR